jgi:hypothetical protein
MARERETVEIEAELIRETELAYLINDGEIECWVPKSLTEHDGESFTMPEWLAQEKGLV